MTDQLHIGFTGTRHGMTVAQHVAVARLVHRMAGGRLLIAHHGDCVGADAQFHSICRQNGARIIVHPGAPGPNQAECEGDERLAGKPNLERNVDIVAASQIMIAAPLQSMQPVRGGGTWYTVRRTRTLEIPLALVLPDGSITRERWLRRRS